MASGQRVTRMMPLTRPVRVPPPTQTTTGVVGRSPLLGGASSCWVERNETRSVPMTRHTALTTVALSAFLMFLVVGT